MSTEVNLSPSLAPYKLQPTSLIATRQNIYNLKPTLFSATTNPVLQIFPLYQSTVFFPVLSAHYARGTDPQHKKLHLIPRFSLCTHRVLVLLFFLFAKLHSFVFQSCQFASAAIFTAHLPLAACVLLPIKLVSRGSFRPTAGPQKKKKQKKKTKKNHTHAHTHAHTQFRIILLASAATHVSADIFCLATAAARTEQQKCASGSLSAL